MISALGQSARGLDGMLRVGRSTTSGAGTTTAETTEVGATEASDTAGAEASGSPSPTNLIDKQQFLMLFISQLQNQDPLNPLDANGMTEQLAQFSSLEQLYNINTNLEGVKDAVGSRDAIDPLRLLDTEVTVPGDTITVADGVAGAVAVAVPAGVTDLQAVLLGPTGAVIRTIDLGTRAPGEFDFVFDGTDGAGTSVPDGSYRIAVSGRDADGEPVTLATLVRDRVTGVDLAAKPPVLLLGARRVAVEDVRSVRVIDTEVEGDDAEDDDAAEGGDAPT
jgi:flagellar basal-body rod modification protein FlgD